jgi:indole-3-glycerol phosphate synthase
MSSTLQKIIDSTRLRVEQAKAKSKRKELEKFAAEHTPRGFRRALEHRAQAGAAIVAELKKASPSKGVIRDDFPVAALARELQHGGATCLSVLTEPEFFLGGLGNLELASSETQLPCLRKDFIIDEFQVLEARAHHADAVLLIVAALDDARLKSLARAAAELKLDVLCEAHDAEEIARAVDAGCNMIGVNARNLHDFSVSLDAVVGLSERIPANVLKVAESGISSGADIAKLLAAGFNAFLVGETLMRAESSRAALRELIAAADASQQLSEAAEVRR